MQPLVLSLALKVKSFMVMSLFVIPVLLTRVTAACWVLLLLHHDSAVIVS